MTPTGCEHPGTVLRCTTAPRHARAGGQRRPPQDRKDLDAPLTQPASPRRGRPRRRSARRVARRARHGGTGKESPRSLRKHEHEDRMRAAEVMMVGNDLNELCDATGEAAACAA